MSVSATVRQPVEQHEEGQAKPRYLECLNLIERLHRQLLDVIKDELERVGQPDVNSVQALLLFNIPVFIAVIVKGRWTATLRRIETASSLLTCAVLAWAVLSGPVFMTPLSDGTAKSIVVLIIAFTLLAMAVKSRKKVVPAPN